MTRLIVFDLDHTLLVANSSFRFGSFLYHHHFFSSWSLLACLSDYARHQWFGMSLQSLHHHSFNRLFKGQSLGVIHHYANQFLKESLTSLFYQPVFQRLQSAQAQGNSVIILSSSPDFLVGKIARYLSVEKWKATTYQTDREGRLEAISHVLEGQGKADYVKKLAQQMSLSLSALTVYSDSYLDLPLLKLAGEAIAVGPDRRLKRVCLQNGWEIL